MQRMYFVTTLCHTDVNECETDNGGCDQLCENTQGSFMCKCNVGYELQYDQKTCKGLSIEIPCYKVTPVEYRKVTV